MYTILLPITKTIYRSALLLLAAIMLYGCSRAHQLGMEDNPEEILERKLNNREAVLTPNQSISLLNHCTQLGTQRAAQAANSEAHVVLGNTGAGKSTTINALMGCRMKRVDPVELGIGGVEEVIIVDPESPRAEVMPIGHGRQSRTFMPQIAQDPDHPNKAYCDCPGFSDNRGAEINIANAINTRSVLQQATGVKAVFLTSYDELSASRGNNIQALENMCKQMFGGDDNLRRYQNAVLLGITKAPFYTRNGEPITRNRVRSLLGDTPIEQILANRLFLFDPMDRGSDNPNFWSLARCRNEIAQLDTIPQQEATSLFQTVLTDSDRTHLLTTVRRLQPKITTAITQGTVAALGQHWQLLQRLSVIEHPEVEQLIEGQVLSAINNAILQRVDTLKDSANAFNFDDAQQQLTELTRIVHNLPGVLLSCNINAIQMHINKCEANKDDKEATERNVAALNNEVADTHRRNKVLNEKIEEASRRNEALNERIEEVSRRNEALAEELRKEQKKGDPFRKIARAVGAVGGFVLGGPAGAAVGYQAMDAITED